MFQEYQDKLEDMRLELQQMAKHVEGIDKSPLSETHRSYLQQAIKLMRMASSAVEEATSYLELD